MAQKSTLGLGEFLHRFSQEWNHSVGRAMLFSGTQALFQAHVVIARIQFLVGFGFRPSATGESPLYRQSHKPVCFSRPAGWPSLSFKGFHLIKSGPPRKNLLFNELLLTDLGPFIFAIYCSLFTWAVVPQFHISHPCSREGDYIGPRVCNLGGNFRILPAAIQIEFVN